ncbi:hypothetical protein [Streptomyces sp. AcE210]|uniref:hypothetical protein n=1 Tax=Streptomyces sp. AcE210 TaxID=2292703 RepID=UPI001F0BB93C|nr:hypothetical protein [Streptomyces sp. AcE210]
MTLGYRMDSLRYLIRDRDSKYTRSFAAIFEADGVEVLLSPPRAPRATRSWAPSVAKSWTAC